MQSVISTGKQFASQFRQFSVLKKCLVLLCAIFGIWLLYTITLGSSKKQTQYQTTQVQKGSIITTVTESGNVTSNSQAGVGSPTRGIVEEIYVKDQDIVTQGQNLFKVKSIATAQEIASATNASQAKLVDQATLEKDRQAIISASQAVTTMQNNLSVSAANPVTKVSYTQNDIDAINSALTSARETFAADEQKYNTVGQNIAAANANVSSAYLSYQSTQDSVVTAPIGGTVANIAVKPGDQVTASAGNLSSTATTSTSTTTGSPILSIGTFTAPYVKVQASEVDINSIKAGEKATITLDAFSGQTFVGTVDQVDTTGVISSGVVTYNVYIPFVSPPATIRPGMSASVAIQTARKDDVLYIPTSAITTANASSTVRVLKNGKVIITPIETGNTSDTDTEITSGVNEGDTIITGVVSTRSSTGASGTASPFGRSVGGFGGGGGGVRGGGGG